MYYVTEYEQYPIYEPAEGGYYYTGTTLCHHIKTTSLKKARKLLKRLARNFFDSEGRLDNETEDYINSASNHIYLSSNHIGEGMEWHIETRLGKHEHGWHPYC